jgi:PAS domain S-box-containing protein
MKNPRLTALPLFAFLAAVAFFACLVVGGADRKMRADLLQQTRLVAQAVEIKRVLALSATETDLDNPHYLQLKEKLAAVRSANPQCRFVYLMGRRADGTVFFFVDSEPASSKDYSPPGQVYDEVPAGFRRVFDTRTTTVEGPVTDRWGTWVSALVPLIDLQNGAVVAVLAMDIDARDWKWGVAADAALPVGLMLVLLIGVAAIYFSDRRVDASPKPVLRHLLPSLTAMVILLIIGALSLLWQQQQNQLAGEVAANISDVYGELSMALDQQAFGMAMAVQPIAANTGVQQALREGNPDRLLASWRPVFETLQRENHLTHFYFFDANRVCLLRVHKPEQHGDLINRFTALKAERTGKTASGIELGPLGTFTLRVVQPVFEGSGLAGYVELGKEIEDVLQSMHTRSGNQLAVAIRKEHLNRRQWEEGMRMIGREADWDRLPHSAIIYASQGRLPDAFLPMADRNTAGDQPSGETGREIAFDGKDWRASAMPLPDVSGAVVGNLLILRDVTVKKAAFARLLVLGGTAGAVLLALLLGFIYVLLRRTDRGISAQQAELRESEERFRQLFDGSKDAIFVYRLDDQGLPGRFIQVNQEACWRLGYLREELLQLTPLDITVPGKAEHQALVAERLKAGGSSLFETIQVAKDGRRIPVECIDRVLPIYGELAVLSTSRDITERKLAAEALQTEKNNLAAILGSSPVGMLVLDETLSIVRANEAAASLVQKSSADILGRQPGDALRCHHAKEALGCGNAPDCQLCPLRNRIASVIAGGGALRGAEFSLELDRGGSPQTVWLSVGAEAILMDGRQHVIVALNDITVRKQAEEALEKRLLSLTRPLDDPADVEFEDLFNLNNIQRLQDEFAEATGVASIITRPDGTPITAPSNFCRLCNDIIRKTEKGRDNCYKSDAVIGRLSLQGPTVQPCMSGGLWDAGAGISAGGRHIANWLIGQVRNETQSEENMRKYARDIGAVESDVIEAFREVPAMSLEQFRRVSQTLFTLANQLSAIAYQNIQQARFIAENKLTEEALRLSSERLQLATHAANIGIWDWDVVKNELVWDDSMYRLYGIHREDFGGAYDAWVRTLHPEDKAWTEGEIQAALSGEREYAPEFRIIWPDGSIRNIKADSQTFRDRDGKPLRMIGTNIDVTERKQAEEALRQSEQAQALNAQRTQTLLQLNQMAEATLQEITDFALEEAVRLTQSKIGYLAFLNEDESILTMHSWSKSAMAECAIDQKPIVYPVVSTGLWGEAVRQRRPIITNDYAALNPWKKSYPQGHVAVKRHMNVPVFDGYRIVIVAGVGNKDEEYEQGDAQQLTLLMEGMWRLIERKRSEEKLRESEFRFRSFFDSNPEGVILMDFDGKIIAANKALAKMSGSSIQEIVNRNFKEFVPADYHDIALGAIRAIKAGMQPKEPAEMVYLAKDGGEIPIAVKGWHITDENSNPVSLGVFVRDLTKVKQLSEEKAAIERQLQQAQKMEAIGTMAGGIAHDFNNILSGIIGYTELAMSEEETSPDKKKQGYLSRVLSASNRAKDLVQQILRFSRHESTAMSPISITPIIKESIKLLRSTFPVTIEIQQNIQSHYDKILADPSQVHQVVMNLCTNAYHAMRERGGILTISLENVVLQTPKESMNLKVQPGNYIKLSISDSGQGIPQQILERIFEPYFTTKKVNEGTGLGLSVIMGIIKSHNGLITVESELDKGTRFDVFFPVVQAITPETAAPFRVAPTGNRERILVVDDEPFFLDVIEKNLEALKYQVIANCSSLKILEIFSGNPTGFDLVITDQTMPEMTGLQLVAEIRKFNSDIPIILCTGYSEMVSEQSARYYGINKFLLKPVVFHDLALAVQEALLRKG